MKILYHPAFERELTSAAEWLEEHEAGLGRRLIEEVESGISRILRRPQSFRRDLGARRCAVNRFRYLIYFEYVKEESLVRVLALAHTSRQPGYWRRRLR
ncbi:MAG: type II toxin-antitoxin system RelE/ParE family toxin [Verrucomicrobiota bacterium JB022]|nr:type II toxin-antitoxin system RelE/ParE family toxin [Verrucomicrobiota bacterium JB022]